LNNVRTYSPVPPGITQNNSNAQFNNAYANALAAGDPRYTVKDYDRGGISRGGAQQNQAGIDAAANLADGIAQAYAQNQQNAQYNANTMLQGQQLQEQNAQALAGFNSQQAYADQMHKLQNQNALAGMLGGMFGTSRPALPDPAQQMAAMQAADNSRGLLGALLR
jgi:hypothetical protein